MHSPSVYQQIASFGPGRRSHFFEILRIGPLCLRFQKSSGLAVSKIPSFSSGNQNLPFIGRHPKLKSRQWISGRRKCISSPQSRRGRRGNVFFYLAGLRLVAYASERRRQPGKNPGLRHGKLLIYLKFFGLKVGLLLNLKEPVMRDGIIRIINELKE